MSERELAILEKLVLITCVVERDLGDRVVHAACAAGAPGATVCYGSGAGVRERLGVLALALDVEREIVYIVVRPEQVDAVFEAVTEAAGLDRPGRGLIFSVPVERCAAHSRLIADRYEGEG